MNPPAVYVVVLNYAEPHETVACVRRLREQDYPNWRLIIVDNQSPDGGEARLREAMPDERIVQRGRNRGYGDGNNLGIEQALHEGADFIWIVTPDVRVEPDCLSRMIRLMEHSPEVGVCGPAISMRGRILLDWRLHEWAGYQAHARAVSEAALADEPERVETDFVEGCAMLLRSRMVRDIGGFRTDFFLYCEECEYCLRARDAGWARAICSQARVHARWNDGHRNARYYYGPRNAIGLARLRRRAVVRAVVRNLLLLPVHRVLRGYPVGASLRAIRDGLRMPLDGRFAGSIPSGERS